MTTTKAMRRLVTQGRLVLNGLVREPACIVCTAIGIDVLEQFGVPATALSVQVDVVNKAWQDWAKAGHPGGQDEALKRGAWMVSCGDPTLHEGNTQPSLRPVDPAKAWDGHVVIRVPGGIIDLDLVALDRPEKKLRVPAAAFFQWPDQTQVASYTLPNGTIIRYEAKPADRSFEQARDWKDDVKRADAVARVARAVRKGRT